MAVEPWNIRDKLMQEKTAIGFFLSGHLFDAFADEVRRFCRTPIAGLSDSQEPQSLAGIVSDVRIVNGQRGRVAIFKLDDGSEAIEAVASEALIEAHREHLVEDQMLVVQGKLQPDRFTGGLRLNVNQIWNLPAARARFGRHMMLEVRAGLPPLDEVLRTWPAHEIETEQGTLRQGLPLRLNVWRAEAVAQIDLGDEARFWPCDEALMRCRSIARGGEARVVYE